MKTLIEKTLTEKKAYIKEIGQAHLVKELVTGLDMAVEDAVDYVYDQFTLTTAEFRMKYFGF